ncbi:granzyme K-like [Paramormyrops kingsleyae]|uniref:granzyme K-like n=1 Tax=Paramormyrops kingsleyae TaxID=1676925 RepID=UPI003B96EE2D
MRLQGSATLAAVCLLSMWALAACFSETIINGKEVKPHSRPWMVSIQVNGHHTCGGVLIKDSWVLTAAHCRRNFKQSLKLVTALLGAHSLTKDKDKDILRVRIDKCVIFPSYDLKTKAGDIMLMKLQREVNPKSKTVKAKALPASGEDVAPRTRCSVTGWGVTTPNGKTRSDTLQEAEVSIMPRLLCADRYSGSKDVVITEDMLCARNSSTGADSCTGDSGGPLLCRGDLVGVVAGGGPPCGNPKKPGVYTRLSKTYLSWISSIISLPKEVFRSLSAHSCV